MDQFIRDNEGPYTNISREERVQHGNRTFRVLLYGEFNAGGLIGSECNGIVVLDEDNRDVLLDEHCKEATGYFGPSQRQLQEFDRLRALDAEQFAEFVNTHPRARHVIELPERQKNRKATKFDMPAYVRLARTPVAYNAELKAKFLDQTRRVAVMIAGSLALNEDQYEVRINPGGIAVSGDVVLHTDRLYVSLSQSPLGPDHGFMYRHCEGRTDYTGGTNRWMKWEQLLDFASAIERFRRAADNVED